MNQSWLIINRLFYLFRYSMWRPAMISLPIEKPDNKKPATWKKCAVLNPWSPSINRDMVQLNFSVSLCQITPRGYSIIRTQRPTCGVVMHMTKCVKAGKCARFEHQILYWSLWQGDLSCKYLTMCWIPRSLYNAKWTFPILVISARINIH